jgi:hypothetical protein
VGAATLSPTLVASTIILPTHSIIVEGSTIAAGRIESTVAFFTASLTYDQAISPDRIESGITFAGHTVNLGAGGEQFIVPPRIESTVAFSTASLSTEIDLYVNFIASSATIFSASISTSAVSILPSRIESTLAFSTASLSLTYALSPSRVESTLAFSTASLVVGGVSVSPDRIESGIVFSPHNVIIGFLGTTPSGRIVDTPNAERGLSVANESGNRRGINVKTRTDRSI